MATTPDEAVQLKLDGVQKDAPPVDGARPRPRPVHHPDLGRQW